MKRLGCGLLAAGVLLACSLLLPSCSAMVVMQTGNFSLEFPSLPADFGPPIPAEGVSGLLLVAQPEDACSELTPPEKAGAPWVALIARSQQKDGCTFDIKASLFAWEGTRRWGGWFGCAAPASRLLVAHAEAAGAVAAVIYDDVFEPLILMAKDPRHPDPFIPSAFVTQKSGILMKRLMVDGSTVVTLTPLSEALWLSMVMSAAAGFLAVNVVLGALWIIRRQHGGIVAGGGPGMRPQPRQGMTASEIRTLPVVVYEEPATAAGSAGAGDGSGSGRAPAPGGELEEAEEGQEQRQQLAGGSDSGSDSGRRGGGTRRVCAICLENYSHGDKLRVLPCQHRYHSCCIDQWLSSRRPVCPVCKADAHAAAGSLLESEGEEEGGGGPGPGPGADLEAGRLPQRSRRRRRRRSGAATFLLGRLGTGWAALRAQFLGVPAAEGGGAAGVAAGAGEVAEQRQQLLDGSRTSSPSPIPAPAGQQQQRQQHQHQHQPESAATLANFPAFFPARAAGGGVESEIVPADAPDAAQPAAGAIGAADAAADAAARPPQLPSFATDSAASSPRGGPRSHLVQSDSTEGSETESELE
ncbi:hypothetical protein CHLNCDRAFT_51582 [Chlorella variabilis]|uniref:RING-type domain-containing protein n=1 Tax=Chlorella variabilis TaxID=554065 RepID=E1ZCE9_CHLVA|nr:hypothetical protein CHLNCDRAFT_51582 [Chlorella variabilis]EFN56592.1 hypothetical protein CHLNCDRAFT_51582 [Chlorella variabilis]|eukprot:XP_005848694.1 hypothetical protein CHLNCDRAFT_51582 [Chlorella variabilis]